MKANVLYLFVLTFFAQNLKAQEAPFNVYIEPVNISGLGGLQSYAFGQHNGKWLIVGGRLDGLHRRQPFASFDLAGHNNQLIVVDPELGQTWSRSLSSLPLSVQEQLSSTNMEFYQQEDYLYCLGGYGYSAIEGDHTTFANLTALYVPGIIDAVINNTELTEFVRQINDPVFQVTGGHLNTINDVFHLLGGQKFIGRYNPMGPDHGPGFIQEYTNQVRRFTLNDDGTNIVINHLPAYTDSLQLHRRDYNTAEQIMPDGSEGVTMFSGVFRPDIDLPYLNSVDVSASGYEVNNNFTQYYNHYHCAVFPLYSEQNNEMHTVFFGGIAQYYDSAGILVQDDNVPFVKTIARVTRNAQGEMNEYKLPVEMPDYLGAGAEFIPNKALTYYTNGVLNLDALQADTTLAGYVFGGISSSAANIFFINTGAESIASSQIYKVYLVNNMPLTSHHHNAQSSGSLKLEIFPNPGDGDFYVKFNLDRLSDVNVSLYNASGKKVDERLFRQLQPGEHMYQKRVRGLHRGGIYSITVETPFEKATRKIIIE